MTNTSKEPKISVVIPVYNVEKYIEKCLNTLIYQTYNNLEIICIDDGSTDNSLSVITDLSQQDNRIKVLSQENKGAGVARNFGIAQSTGEYISFIDADDWVLLDLYEKFVNSMNKVREEIDIFMFNVGSYQSGVNDVVPRTFFSISDWQNHTSPLTVHNFDDCQNPLGRNLSVCNKIFRSKFLKENNLTFIENIKYEDQPFYFISALKAKSILITDEILYKYRNYEKGSLTTESTPKVFDIFKIVQIIEDEIIKSNLFESYKYALFQYKYNLYYYNYSNCPEDLKEKYFNTMKDSIEKFKQTSNLNINICKKLRNYDLIEKFLNK